MHFATDGPLDVSDVDVVILRRDGSAPPDAVTRALAAQTGVHLQLHQVVGARQHHDSNAWAVIARARNRALSLGCAPWVMFVDDDVVLGPGCVAALCAGLRARPHFGALAADYLGELADGSTSWECTWHVAMGATMFRRDRLALIRFRWEPGSCECQCACNDLRRAGFAIGYLPEAQARHDRALNLRNDQTCRLMESSGETRSTKHHEQLAGRVLAAFDRKHLGRFQRLFLASLRAAGNNEPVTAVAYGLHPSEERTLSAMPGVEVIAVPVNGTSPARRRIHEFQAVLSRWPGDTPVAYWDAGDVVFQDRIAPLWELIRAQPDALLMAREPIEYPENRAIVDWTSTIIDPDSRRHVFGVLSTHPFLNSGLLAGTVRSLLPCLQIADGLLHSDDLRGTLHWADQVAVNLYCHAHPDAWRELPEGWNYCLYGRDRRSYRVRSDGYLEARDGTPVHVVHGNGLTLRQAEFGAAI